MAEALDAPEDLITMDNGCVCCSVRGDLVRTLGHLAKRRKDFDAILLETTGLADPAPIVYTIQTNSKMSENYYIDSIVALADCKHLHLHLDDVKPDGSANEALQQVAFADKILLNKVDLVTVEEKEKLKARLATINKFATVIEMAGNNKYFGKKERMTKNGHMSYLRTQRVGKRQKCLPIIFTLYCDS